MTDQRYLIVHQRTLRMIENRIPEEVSIGRTWRAIGGALAVALAGTAVAWWLEAISQESPRGHPYSRCRGHGACSGVGGLGAGALVATLPLVLRRGVLLRIGRGDRNRRLLVGANRACGDWAVVAGRRRSGDGDTDRGVARGDRHPDRAFPGRHAQAVRPTRSATTEIDLRVSRIRPLRADLPSVQAGTLSIGLSQHNSA